MQHKRTLIIVVIAIAILALAVGLYLLIRDHLVNVVMPIYYDSPPVDVPYPTYAWYLNSSVIPT